MSECVGRVCICIEANAGHCCLNSDAFIAAKAKLNFANGALLRHQSADARGKLGAYVQKLERVRINTARVWVCNRRTALMAPLVQLRRQLAHEQDVVLCRAGPSRVSSPQWGRSSPSDVACGEDHTVVVLADGRVRADRVGMVRPRDASTTHTPLLHAGVLVGHSDARQAWSARVQVPGRK